MDVQAELNTLEFERKGFIQQVEYLCHFLIQRAESLYAALRSSGSGTKLPLFRAHDRRLLVGLTGEPASGKSTLAAALAIALNAQKEVAVMIPLDGWHLSHDAVEAHARRGAPFTFDSAAYVHCIQSLRTAPSDQALGCPSFDHALKDPVQNDIWVRAHHRIILVEGLYVLRRDEPWAQASKLLDERWLIDTDPVLSRDRLIARHIKSGIVNSPAEAALRADGSDKRNWDETKVQLYEPYVKLRLAED